MREVIEPDSAIRARYLAAIKSDRMVGALKTTASFVIGVNSLFLLLDLASHPESFSVLFSVRMAWNAAMAAIYWLADRADPLRMLQAGVMASGVALIALIAAAGGLSSDYWPGMMILFVGIPVFLPVSGRQSAVLSGTLLAAFAAMPLITGETLSTREYVAPVFFVGAAALECVASSALLDRLRFGEFQQRLEIEAARDHLKEMDEIKARFTANIHHELRTPLTLTLAPLESLLSGEFGAVTEQQRAYMETMHVNALRLLKLINNLLDLAKVESGELSIRRVRTDISRLARDLINGAKPLAERKGVDIRLSIPDESLSVNADVEAIEKVLVNLLGNALKFTDSGGSIDVTVARGQNDSAYLSVSDTGIGLNPTDIERIFDRFAQVDSSATRRHEGTGIGLSLSKELVALHGGEIWAESEGLGRGTTVHVLLPKGNEDIEPTDELMEVEPDAPITARTDQRYIEIERTITRGGVDREHKNDDADEGRSTVLVCEDNGDMRQLLYDLLVREFNVLVASNGREALDRVAERKPDVVVTDVMMPELSGIELCERLKADPETRGIPVILVTSKAEREMKISGLEMGADDYVTKPFHSRELLARVRSFVRLRRLQEEVEDRNAALERANEELGKAMHELKETEARLVHIERLSAVGELAAGVAHEINNPVNFATTATGAMVEYLHELRTLVEKGTLEGEDVSRDGVHDALAAIHELAGVIRDGLDRTGQLVGDLKDFATPWKGSDEPIDIDRAIRSAAQLLAYLYQDAGVTLTIGVGEGLPVVRGDARAIGQVVLNLLKNAVEAFVSPGGTVSATAVAKRGGVEIAIQDSGPGMDAGTLKQVFEPFFSTKDPGKGTGLGLSISRQVVVQHGGTIRVESEPGRGATFFVWLPGESCDAV